MSHALEAAKTSRATFGFWLYLMTDCVLFAALFATYAVMRGQTNGGPTGSELFDLPFVLVETILLLASSFTCGLVLLAAQNRQQRQVLGFMALTLVLGLAFVGMELYEFRELAHEGAGWQRSGFLSSYFTLVGTHGLHILIGLLWLTVMMVRIARRGFGPVTSRRLQLFSMFWHFLDVVWIFIFSIVYLWSGRFLCHD
jgi:cytochrome o ubiquinol oxidase subunit III